MPSGLTARASALHRDSPPGTAGPAGTGSGAGTGSQRAPFQCHTSMAGVTWGEPMAHASEADMASMPVTIVPGGSGQTIRQPGTGCAGASAATHEGVTGSALADSTIADAVAAPATMAAAAATATAALRPNTVRPRGRGYAGSDASSTLPGAVWLQRKPQPAAPGPSPGNDAGWLGPARVSPRRNQRQAPAPRPERTESRGPPPVNRRPASLPTSSTKTLRATLKLPQCSRLAATGPEQGRGLVLSRPYSSMAPPMWRRCRRKV
jgi:hypothetical protein